MAVISVTYTDDGFAIIKMHNGENRLNNAYLSDMNAILDDVERNEDVKAVLTTGEGKFFCNGIDVQWMLTQTEEVVADFLKNLGILFWRLIHFPVPTVAVINGHAFAGGAFIAYVHDYRVMNSKRGWICLNEIKIDKPIDSAGCEILRYKIPRHDVLRDAVLFARRFSAEDGKACGIIEEVAEPENLLQTAKTVALKALGPTGLNRDMLQTMKKDLFPRTTSYTDTSKLFLRIKSDTVNAKL